jgi:hypothetical protein
VKAVIVAPLALARGPLRGPGSLLGVALAAATAAADPLDEVGFGAAATGMASSRTAIEAGAAAAHENPAGIARVARPEVLVGWQYSIDHLAIDDHDAGVVDAHGTSIGLALPFSVGEFAFGVGLALYLPDQYLARLQLTPVSEPHFARFETAAQRLSVEPVAAVAWGDLAIGAGASILSDARSNELTFNVGLIGGEKQGTADLDISLPTRAAPLVGVWWRPHPEVELAGTFRGELSLDLALDIRANVQVPGVVTGDAIVSLRSVNYFTPMRTAVAGAWHPRDDLTVTGDVAWERWSALGSGVPDLRVLIALDIQPPQIGTTTPPAHFHDIVTERAGVEWRPGWTALGGDWRLRAGAAHLPSPVPAQTGLTSFADGRRIVASAGAGLRIPAGYVLTQPVDVDVALGWQHVAHELVHKDMDLVPGGAFSSGGDIVQTSLSSTVRF